MGRLSPDAWAAAALEGEELLLARIAELAGVGLDAAAIARRLHVGIGLVLEVLRA